LASLQYAEEKKKKQLELSFFVPFFFTMWEKEEDPSSRLVEKLAMPGPHKKRRRRNL
jgi:hypothetical protein